VQVVNKWIKEYKNSLEKEEVKEGVEEAGLESPALHQDPDLPLYHRNIPTHYTYQNSLSNFGKD